MQHLNSCSKINTLAPIDTGGNGFALYSSAGNVGSDLNAAGYTTIDESPAQKFLLDKQKQILAFKENRGLDSKWEWHVASENLAGNYANGNVGVLTRFPESGGEYGYQNSVFYKSELPALLDNPNVKCPCPLVSD